MTESLSRIPGGLRYYFGAEARLRRTVEDTVMAVFDGWSYEEITTPSIDYYALFERGMGRDEAQRAFRFMDTDGRLLALRPDVTSSVARAAATLFASRTRPLRLCYAAPVFRQQTQSHAEYRRESTHLGCEFIGPGGRLADMEMLAIAVEVLERLGLENDYCITLNSAEIFNGVAAGLSLDANARAQMHHLIDIRDTAELQRFLASYSIPLEDRAAFSELTQLSGKREILDQSRRVITNARSVAALDAIEWMWRVVETLGLTERFEIDLGDVSGLDYYTGLTFKIYLSGAGARVGSGGRYDELTANFGRREPAVGFVLDLDALTDVLARKGSTEASRSNPEASDIEAEEADALFLEARRRRARGEQVRATQKDAG
ncbi:MAG TPA: ATP phosphoribosyltransferase regulatory subunit [Pyrinomonadaceae bacterium]|jgi:ATP phosphoribosyltransferase regulatory subunit|nr:ATP phosphoribosyltransferase regulatory subunit [Pyrinomonadaceae bacterium]